MAGILERVFPLDSKVDVLAEYRSTRFSCVPSTLILGPTHCQKSAMLIQAAMSEAAAEGQVLFISPQKLHHLPPSVHGMPQPSSLLLENIKFLYAQEECEVTGYLATLHMIPSGDRPSLIVIDDLQFYSLPKGRVDTASQMVNAARILSLAQESAEFCTSSSECRTAYPCSVLVSWTLGGTGAIKREEVEAFAKIVCHHVWTVQKRGKKQGCEEYELVEGEQGHTCTVAFSLRSFPSPHLLLHQVTLQEEREEEEEEAKDAR